MPNGVYSSDHPAVLSHVARSRVSPPVKGEEPGTRLGVRHLADPIEGEPGGMLSLRRWPEPDFQSSLPPPRG